ncbi:centrosomal protein 78kDa [Nesidiocoris tenuis]|uniref:Centrosomal protein 78kDa n=2 Tax=Nesidiocoris tenuis TaxID=355587 RepID=A0ABN7B3A5_9HEMI|nr:centrosomal protein 78kDa [Nesidiocoris tenuis]
MNPNLKNFQDISRYNECWKHSLRCREVNTDVILGLRRLTINENHEIRDKGLKYIIDALYDDNWIKAIDMQNCGITDWGCSAVHKLLETNKEIVVFDLRKNDIVDMTAIASMISILGSHMTGDDMTEFGWMDIDSPICASSSEDSSSGGASGHTSAFSLVRSNQKVSNYILSNCQGQERLRTIQSAAALSFPRRSQTSLRQCRQLQMASRSKSLHGSMALVEFTGRSLLNRTGGLTRTSLTLAKARTGQKSANPARQLQVANWQADVNRRLSSLTVSKTPPAKSLRSTQSEQRLGSTKKSIPLRTVSSENKSKEVVESRKEENTGKSTEEEKILKLLELSCPKVKPAVDREESKSVAREMSSILQTKNAETFSIENYPLDINAFRMLQTNDTVTKKHQRCSYFKRLDVDGDD